MSNSKRGFSYSSVWDAHRSGMVKSNLMAGIPEEQREEILSHFDYIAAQIVIEGIVNSPSPAGVVWDIFQKNIMRMAKTKSITHQSISAYAKRCAEAPVGDAVKLMSAIHSWR